MTMYTIHDFVKQLQRHAVQIQGDCAQKTLRGISDPNEYFKIVGRSQGVAELADIAYQLMKRADLDDDDPDGDGSGLLEMPSGEKSASGRGGR